MPASGGEPRTVLQVQRPDAFELNQGRMPWTPDGRSVLVVLRRQGQRQLAVVRVDSGAITPLPFAPQQGGRRSLALHPDGRQLVYVDGVGRDDEAQAHVRNGEQGRVRGGRREHASR